MRILLRLLSIARITGTRELLAIGGESLADRQMKRFKAAGSHETVCDRGLWASTVPFRYGDYIVKFSMAPAKLAMTALTGRLIDVVGREDAIREEVQKEMRGIDAEWSFRVQLCRDLQRATRRGSNRLVGRGRSSLS